MFAVIIAGTNPNQFMRRAPFRKDCDEYTTKRLMRQVLSVIEQEVQNLKKMKKSARFGNIGSAVFLLWEIWYDLNGMV